MKLHPVLWNVDVAETASVVRGARRRVCVVRRHKGEWLALGIEGPKDAIDVEAVTTDHAHVNLGSHGLIAKAKGACIDWLFSDAPACSCGPLGLENACRAVQVCIDAIDSIQLRPTLPAPRVPALPGKTPRRRRTRTRNPSE